MSFINQTNIKNIGAKIEAMARRLVHYAAIIVLCYLAWRGASDLVTSAHNASQIASYAAIFGLLCLIALV